MGVLSPTGHDWSNMSIKPGDLLIAHPEMQHDFFSRAVVLITESSALGVTGFVLNRKTIAELANSVSRNKLEWPYQDFMFEGGPLNRSALVMIHTPEWYSSNTLRIKSHVSISSDQFMFEKMVTGNVPIERRFVYGQSIWSPGQLEKELDQPKTWLTTSSTQSIIFEYDGEEQWRKAIDHCAQDAIDSYF